MFKTVRHLFIWNHRESQVLNPKLSFVGPMILILVIFQRFLALENSLTHGAGVLEDPLEVDALQVVDNMVFEPEGLGAQGAHEALCWVVQVRDMVIEIWT